MYFKGILKTSHVYMCIYIIQSNWTDIDIIFFNGKNASNTFEYIHIYIWTLLNIKRQGRGNYKIKNSFKNDIGQYIEIIYKILHIQNILNSYFSSFHWRIN